MLESSPDEFLWAGVGLGIGFSLLMAMIGGVCAHLVRAFVRLGADRQDRSF